MGARSRGCVDDVGAGDRFDELARGLANGTISRRRALRLGGAAVLGGMFAGIVLRPDLAAAGRRHRCRDCSGSPACDVGVCEEDFCSCVEDVRGRTCCVVASCERSGKECNDNSDCGEDRLCSPTAISCCGTDTTKAGICVHRCTHADSLSAQRNSSGPDKWEDTKR